MSRTWWYHVSLPPMALVLVFFILKGLFLCLDRDKATASPAEDSATFTG
ncbi:hypothetical protein [Actinomadura sp. NBRC 104412]|nr:hypothetical protein [Actinomadura sp. NBRC 104412]